MAKRERILFALLIALFPSTPITNGQGKEQAQPVGFCELTKHPDRYLNKLVQIDASYVSWWESSYLYHIECENDEQKLHAGVDCANDKECKQIGAEIYGMIKKNQRPDKDNFAFFSDIRITGRLVGPGSYGHLGSFRYEFRIRNVEKAAPMSKDKLPKK